MKNNKEIKVIDYDLTIKDFFKSVIAFLEAQKGTAKTKQEYNEISENIKRINKIASNPRVYSSYQARVDNNIEPEFAGFAKTSMNGIVADNRKFLAFQSVLNAIAEYYSEFGFDKEKKLLTAIKRWRYSISTSMFKDFTFSFKPLESFASRTTIDRQR